MFCALSGILLAGATYFGVSPTTPLERIDHMIGALNVTTFICENISTHSFSGLSVNLHSFELIMKHETSHLFEQIVASTSNFRNLLYVIMTSGSTGAPKFVGISHENFYIAYMAMQSRKWCDELEVVTLQVASSMFDAHIMEILCPLAKGATIALLNSEKALNIAYIVDTIAIQNVTQTLWVPSMADAIAEYANLTNSWEKMSSITDIFFGGEAIHERTLHEFRNKMQNPAVSFHNFYGPAECSIVSISHVLTSVSNNIIPIGKPLPNYKCFVLDDAGQHLPLGLIGQLFIGGRGVFSGYINQPELNANALVSIPSIYPEGLLYRTGDLAKVLPDGNIVFMGRADFQVRCFFPGIQLPFCFAVLLILLPLFTFVDFKLICLSVCLYVCLRGKAS
jgi:non-ribosomal peptide synthetase component F